MRFRVWTESYYFNRSGAETAYPTAVVVEADSEEFAHKYALRLARQRRKTAHDHRVIVTVLVADDTPTTHCPHYDMRSNCQQCRREYNREYGRKRRGTKNPRVFASNGLSTAKTCAAGHHYIGRRCPDCVQGVHRHRSYCSIHGYELTAENSYVWRRRSGRIGTRCMECQKAYMRAWNESHRDVVRNAIRNWAQRNREYVRRYRADWDRRRRADPVKYAARLAYNRQWLRRAKEERGWDRRTRRLPKPQDR